MIDRSQTIVLPNVSAVTIFADDLVAEGYYVLPQSPRLKSVDGQPTLQLLILGRREHGLFEASGGLFTCTTSLELTAIEQQTVTDALRSVLPKAKASLVQLMPISWTYGSVSLKADPVLALQGAPSLIAGNDCVFQAKLSQHDAKTLEKQWRREGYILNVSYKVGVLTRGPSEFMIEGTLRSAPSEVAQLIRRIDSP